MRFRALVMMMLMLLGCTAVHAQGAYDANRYAAQNELRAGGWLLSTSDTDFDRISLDQIASASYAPVGSGSYLDGFVRGAVDRLANEVRASRPDVAQYLNDHRADIYNALANAVRMRTSMAPVSDFLGCGVITIRPSTVGLPLGGAPARERYQLYVRVRVPSGPMPGVYFTCRGAAYFSPNGRAYVSFVSPKHLEFFRTVAKGDNLGEREPSQFGTNAGTAILPEGYFSYGGAVWYTDGRGNLVVMSSVPALQSHQAMHPRAAKWGELDVDPRTFLKQTGSF